MLWVLKIISHCGKNSGTEYEEKISQSAKTDNKLRMFSVKLKKNIFAKLHFALRLFFHQTNFNEIFCSNEHLVEMINLSTHNICFGSKNKKNNFQLSGDL